MTIPLKYSHNFFESQPEISALLVQLGISQSHSGNLDGIHQAIQTMQKALAIQEENFSKEPIKVAFTLTALALLFKKLGDNKSLETAIRYGERALAIYEKLDRKFPIARLHENLALTLAQLGNLYHLLGKKQNNIITYKQRAISIWRNLLLEEKLDSIGLFSFAECLATLGDKESLAESIHYFKQVLVNVQNKLLTEQNDDIGFLKMVVLNHLGNTLSTLGGKENWQEAIYYHQQALAIAEQQFDEYHSEVGATLNSLARASLYLGIFHLGNEKILAAIEYGKRALRITEQCYGRYALQTAQVLFNLGFAFFELKDKRYIEIAIEYYQRALVIREKLLHAEHPDIIENLDKLAMVLCDNKSYQESIKCWERVLTYQERHLDKNAFQLATLLGNLGSACGYNNNTQKAIAYLQRAVAILDQQKEKIDVLETKVIFLYDLGIIVLNSVTSIRPQNPDDKEKLKQTIEYLQQALNILKKLPSRNNHEITRIHHGLAIAFNKLNDKESLLHAINYYEQILPVWKNQANPNLPVLLFDLSKALFDVGTKDNLLQAIEYLQQALIIQKKQFGEQHSQIALILDYIGRTFRQLGIQETSHQIVAYNQQAIEYFQQALTIKRKLLGEEHVEVFSLLRSIALAAFDLGSEQNLHKAIEYFLQALSILQKQSNKNYAQIAILHNNLATAFFKLKDKESLLLAIKHYEQALPIWRNSADPNLPDLLFNLSNTLFELGNKDNLLQAIEYLQQVVIIQKKQLGEEHPQIAALLNKLGSAFRQLGGQENFQHAIAYHRQALAMREKHLSKDNVAIAVSLNNLAASFIDLGGQANLQEAFAYLTRALPIAEKSWGHEHPSTLKIRNRFENLEKELAANADNLNMKLTP